MKLPALLNDLKSFRVLGGLGAWGVAALLFLGALFWAKGRDPFRRVWFTVKEASGSRAECVAILPKTASQPLPVVVYLHGAGESLLMSGGGLRQMAEMGLATVGMDYEQASEAGFEAQFTVLLNYLRRQKWADTHRMAWVGFSLGAQRSLAFALRHPELGPKVLVRLGGGWVPELEESKVQSLKSKAEGGHPAQMSVVLVHGGRDEVFPLAEAERVRACLQSNGVPVEMKVFPEETHGANRLLLFRAVGEHCLTQLGGPAPWSHYQSILSWQAKAKPLWVYWLPAAVWGAYWSGWAGRRVWNAPNQPSLRDLSQDPPQPNAEALGYSQTSRRDEDGSQHAKGLEAGLRMSSSGHRLRGWEIALRWMAGTLALAAAGQTALHLVPPRLCVDERTLSLARKHLVTPKERQDFEVLAEKALWRGKRLKILLEHVELANYNRELVNWKLDDQVYREFVLSPEIDPALDGGLDWRRPLWENFYPRIRKEGSTGAAAEIVARFLRERVTIAEGEGFPTAIKEAWQRQITNARGFEALYVAAMRSVGIPARLNSQGRAEHWSGSAWNQAPRPLIEQRW